MMDPNLDLEADLNNKPDVNEERGSLISANITEQQTQNKSIQNDHIHTTSTPTSTTNSYQTTSVSGSSDLASRSVSSCRFTPETVSTGDSIEVLKSTRGKRKVKVKKVGIGWALDRCYNRQIYGRFFKKRFYQTYQKSASTRRTIF